MIRVLFASCVLLLLPAVQSRAAELPVGSSPAPLDTPHFPDRVHAFVWRNWNVVPTARVAKVLGTSEANVREMARAMGLPAEEAVSQRVMDRSYLTVIRRNWHLLPYEQLLELLDWTPDRLPDRRCKRH